MERSALQVLGDLWREWQQQQHPTTTQFEYRRGQHNFRCSLQFLTRLGGRGAALDWIRPLLANESDPRYPLIRIVEMSDDDDEELDALVHAAGTYGARGVLLGWVPLRRRHDGKTPLVAWNPAVPLEHDGLCVFLTPIGRVLQRAEDLAMSARLAGPARSVGDAVLGRIEPRAMYAEPWLAPVCHILGGVPRGNFFGDLARGQFEWDAARRTLNIRHLLMRGYQPLLADFALYVIGQVALHLGADEIWIPYDSGVHTQCSHPELYFRVVQRPHCIMRVPDRDRTMDSGGSSDSRHVRDLDAAAVPAYQLPEQGQVPDEPEANAIRQAHANGLWDYLVALQVPEPPARQRDLTVERGVDFGWDGALVLIVTQPDRTQSRHLLALSAGKDEGDVALARPVRRVHIRDYRHPLMRTQPAVAREIAADIHVLRDLVARFLHYNHHDVPASSYYRVVVTLDGALDAFLSNVSPTAVELRAIDDGARVMSEA